MPKVVVVARDEGYPTTSFRCSWQQRRCWQRVNASSVPTDRSWFRAFGRTWKKIRMYSIGSLLQPDPKVYPLVHVATPFSTGCRQHYSSLSQQISETTACVNTITRPKILCTTAFGLMCLEEARQPPHITQALSRAQGLGFVLVADVLKPGLVAQRPKNATTAKCVA